MKILSKILIAAALFCCAPAFSTPALVQKANNHCTSAITCTFVLSSVQNPDGVIIVFGGGTTEALGSITDSVNTINACTPYSSSGGAPGFGIYYVQNATAGPHTVTVNFSTAQNITGFIMEYSGVASTGLCDKTSVINENGSTSITTAPITPTNAGELVIFGVIQSQASNTYSNFLNGITQQDSYNANGPSGTWGSAITGSAISGAATGSTTDVWSAAVAAFVASSGGTCTHSGFTAAGGIAVPNGSSGSYRLANGSIGTPDCSTKTYCDTAGSCTVN